MRKLTLVLGLLVGLFLASSAQAAGVSCAAISGSQKSVACSCASGTCDAPTTAATTIATGGLHLGPTITWVDVVICPTTAGATLTATKVDVYFYDVGGWAKYNASVYSGSANTTADGCVQIPFDSPAKGFPVGSRRAAWMMVIPNGTTTSAGGVSVKLLASGPSGSL